MNFQSEAVARETGDNAAVLLTLILNQQGAGVAQAVISQPNVAVPSAPKQPQR